MTDILSEGTEGERECVYLGTITDSKNKTHAMFILAEALDGIDASDDDAPRQVKLLAGWYPGKRGTGRTIGGRYLTKCTVADGKMQTVWFDSLRYVGQHASPLVAVFQADAITEKDREYRQKNERKAQEPVFMRDMERTVEALRALPKRQALDIVHAISVELRRQVLAK